MSAGNLQRVRVRERETKAVGEEARSKDRKAWLKTDEEKKKKEDALVLDGEKATAGREECEKRRGQRSAN